MSSSVAAIDEDRRDKTSEENLKAYILEEFGRNSPLVENPRSGQGQSGIFQSSIIDFDKASSIPSRDFGYGGQRNPGEDLSGPFAEAENGFPEGDVPASLFSSVFFLQVLLTFSFLIFIILAFLLFSRRRSQRQKRTAEERRRKRIRPQINDKQIQNFPFISDDILIQDDPNRAAGGSEAETSILTFLTSLFFSIRKTDEQGTYRGNPSTGKSGSGGGGEGLPEDESDDLMSDYYTENCPLLGGDGGRRFSASPGFQDDRNFWDDI